MKSGIDTIVGYFTFYPMTPNPLNPYIIYWISHKNVFFKMVTSKAISASIKIGDFWQIAFYLKEFTGKIPTDKILIPKLGVSDQTEYIVRIAFGKKTLNYTFYDDDFYWNYFSYRVILIDKLKAFCYDFDRDGRWEKNDTPLKK